MRSVSWFGIDGVLWVYMYVFGEIVVRYAQKQDVLML